MKKWKQKIQLLAGLMAIGIVPLVAPLTAQASSNGIDTTVINEKWGSLRLFTEVAYLMLKLKKQQNY
ncbi:hypothetical protein LZ578_05305 [Jeotgalibaca sp. MA1X17-3]|uniref:hypothetical protein n=1 Tax=Jeotgalibaca sp. MA1X17-3 TaxID=2908211 RepID=UPI001F44E657|nr:hypothetical protein [Jeotgalibaca sp. MA1X17-3]UJF16521.1 hypothetical protein LZ578_05305 [Jeotgalibaca sp. MA1X17-3]